MHVAILANASNYHLQRWLPALTARGIRISLLSFVAPEKKIPGVDHHQLVRPTRHFASHSIADFVLGTRSTREYVSKLSPDILLGSYATNYGFLGARLGIKPYLLQTWTADIQLYPSVGPKRFVFGPMVRFALRNADAITTDGPALLQVLAGSFPGQAEKATSILWGIDVDEFTRLSETRSAARHRLGLKDDDVVVTLARGLRFHDRPDISLPALLDIVNEHENVSGVVLTLGHQPSPDVERVLARLRKHSRVKIIDHFLDRSSMNDIWAASDFAISIPLFDGISESLIECMAVGCIPILSDIPPNRILVPDRRNAIFSAADSSNSLKMAIDSGLSNLEQLKHSAITANRNWVRENASIDIAADRLAGLLFGLVDKEDS